MPKLNSRRKILYAFIIASVLAAYVFRYIDIAFPVRGAVYIALLSVWGVSIYIRTIQTSLRSYLLSIAFLLMFWVLVRTVKYSFVQSEVISRLLWYCYYIPILVIPLLAVYLAMSMGHSEEYAIPKKFLLLLIPMGALLVLVLTNDLHRLIFRSPNELPLSGSNYEYTPLYLFIVIWEFGGAVAAYFIMRRKCRYVSKKTLLPMIPIIALIVFCISYLFECPFVFSYISKDITIFSSLCIMTCLELAILTGLIPSNTHYFDLFRITSMAVQIIDKDFNVMLSSDTAKTYDADVLEKTVSAPVLLDDGVRLSSAGIRGGYVVWQDDVSDLTEMVERLNDTNEFLRGKNTTLAEKVKTDMLHRRLFEKNRLYNIMQMQTASKLHELEALVDRLDHISEQDEERDILARIAVLGAYIKRRNNLIFLAEEECALPTSELYYCIRESMQSLALFGTACEYRVDCDTSLPFSEIMRLYDAFEDAIEDAMGKLSSAYVSVTEGAGFLAMSIRLAGPEHLCEHPELTVSQEDDFDWLLSMCVPNGGPA
ncbi:MAG: histidine kinase N-terminal 7TM domain-containing protein [Christensenellales bacterium]